MLAMSLVISLPNNPEKVVFIFLWERRKLTEMRPLPDIVIVIIGFFPVPAAKGLPFPTYPLGFFEL